MQELEKCIREGEKKRADEIVGTMQGWELVELEEALQGLNIAVPGTT